MATQLAIVATHPIQYFAPWFQQLAAAGEISFRVFYLSSAGSDDYQDPGFGQLVRWDVPLLAGYEHEFVRNLSPAPSTHRFLGLWNPSIVRRLREYRPDAVLLLGYNFATFMHVILSPGRSMPLVFRGDSHRLMPRRGIREHIRRALIRAVFRRFSAFLYVGKANYAYFRLHGVPEGKLFRSPHAVDNMRFESRPRETHEEARGFRRSLGIADEKLVVMFVGKFEENKRPQDLLEAFLAARPANACLVFVGAGELEGALRERAAGEAHVRFAPFQNQSVMPRTYLAADLVVLPSPSETWGLVVNEAMCMGRPVVVSDHVGCAADLVVPFGNGLVFPARDVKALARCLREAISNPQRLREWGGRSREIIAEHSYAEATKGLMAALRSLE